MPFSYGVALRVVTTDFMLLLAVASEGIGMVIIAIWFGDPLHPLRPQYLPIAFGGIGSEFHI